jgi:hypothetical protein
MPKAPEPPTGVYSLANNSANPFVATFENGLFRKRKANGTTSMGSGTGGSRR